MNQKVDEISEKIFRKKYEHLGEREKKLLIISPREFIFREMSLKTFLNN